jgi:peptidyl-prolyl cis-trans isomerase SurA
MERIMKRAASFLFLALIGLSPLTLATIPASAQSSIKIKVDDQPITSYDITQRTRLLQLVGIKGGQKVATQELIDETLQFIEAAKRGMSTPDSRVDAAIAQISQSMKMTPDQLEAALGQQGIDIDTLRRRIKAQMTWQRLVEGRSQFEGSVRNSDVTAALFQDGAADSITTTEYTLQQIVFIVPSGSSAAYEAQRRREAEAYRQRFAGCDQSLEQVKQLKGVVVRNIGRRTSQELSGTEGEEIRATGVGRTTRPIKTSQGFDLVAVCTARELNSNAAARTAVESKLLQEKNQELGKEYLAELREKAVIEYR